jgi:hypothetical protein
MEKATPARYQPQWAVTRAEAPAVVGAAAERLQNEHFERARQELEF